MTPTEQFERDGYIFVEKLIEPRLLDRFENLILSRACIDLRELGIACDGLTPFETMRLLESNSRHRFFKLCAIGTAVAGLQIATHPVITEVIETLFGAEGGQIFNFPPAIFWNDRPVTRLQYKWHQESTYLQAYERLITLWFPLFRDLAPEDGPMIVARGSHKEVYPYTFAKEPSGVTQFAVSDEIASRFEQVPCALKRGDGVLFHRDLLHKTGENLTGSPRVSCVIRYFDILRTPEFEPLIVPNNITNKDAIAGKAVVRS
ncbi:MAG TPA: phytanoyl-CoA dioxygenase family protein [Burkholderiales bacterium]|nr:phytanoyl-CoA dioxygenase family protein [Burkholderiales bacterium]